MTTTLNPHVSAVSPASLEHCAGALLLRSQEFLQLEATTPIPGISGRILRQCVQPGLFATGGDISYDEDRTVFFMSDRSLVFSILLEGHLNPTTVNKSSVVQVPHQPSVLVFGDDPWSTSVWSRGQRNVVAGFVMTPEFLEHATDTLGNALPTVNALLNGPSQGIALRPAPMLSRLAGNSLSHGYAGGLSRLFLEGNTLQMLAGALAALGEQSVSAQRGPDWHRAHAAREIIDTRLADPPSTRVLAREIGTNVTTLQSAFRKTFGLTVFGYVREQRLAVAQILLLETDLPVSQVGYRVGFLGAAAFAAAYRQRFGRAPGQERRNACFTRQ